MTYVLDIESFDDIAPRQQRVRTPSGTDPLVLGKEERRSLDEISEIVGRYVTKRSLSAYDQFLVFHSALVGMDRATAGDWAGLSAAAVQGLRAAFRVQGVSPYLIGRQDDAKRNLASEQRRQLKELALRLGQAREGGTQPEIDMARCLRAMTCAAICADRGLIHHAKENFGVVVATVCADGFHSRRKVPLFPDLVDYGRRFARAGVKMP